MPSSLLPTLKRVSGYVNVFVVVVSNLITIFWTNWRNEIFSNSFWDLTVYITAVDQVAGGENPYAIQLNNEAVRIVSGFPYHPYILLLFVRLNDFFPLKFFLFTFSFLALIFFLRSLLKFLTISDSNFTARSTMKSFLYSLLIVLVCITCGGAGLIGLLSGNIAFILHIAIIGCALSLIAVPSRRNNLFFLFLIFIGFMVKPYFLTYLIFSFFVYPILKAARLSFVVILICLITWFSAAVLMNEDFKLFLNSVEYVTFDIGDFGFSIFGTLRSQLGDTLALFFHISIISVLTITTLYIIQQYYTRLSLEIISAIPMTLFLIIMANPRMKEYDFGVMYLVILPIIYWRLNSFRISILTLAFFVFITRYGLFLINQNLKIIPSTLLYLRYWEICVVFSLCVYSLICPVYERRKQLFNYKVLNQG